MRKIVVMFIIVILPILLMGRWLVNEGAATTPSWHIQDLRIWKQTPIWKLALAVNSQDSVSINKFAKAHPEWLNYQEPCYGATLLIWAVGVEKYKSAEALLKCGANPNIQTTQAGETALFVAANFSWVDIWAKHDPKYVKLLLKYGADPNITYVGFKPPGGGHDATEAGTSPLIESIGCSIEKTKALVDGGADINYKTASGRTAAIKALLWGDGTLESMRYAQYLIVEKKAKITDPYVRGELFTMPHDNPNEKFYPVNLLRNWITMDSAAHKMKMAIVDEFSRQGVDYWKTEIPKYTLINIQKLYPDTWQEYIKQY